MLILGQENDDGTFSPFQMSFEHNADNENEVKRLLQKHPNGKILFLAIKFRINTRNDRILRVKLTFLN